MDTTSKVPAALEGDLKNTPNSNGGSFDLLGNKPLPNPNPSPAQTNKGSLLSSAPAGQPARPRSSNPGQSRQPSGFANALLETSERTASGLTKADPQTATRGSGDTSMRSLGQYNPSIDDQMKAVRAIKQKAEKERAPANTAKPTGPRPGGDAVSLLEQLRPKVPKPPKRQAPKPRPRPSIAKTSDYNWDFKKNLYTPDAEATRVRAKGWQNWSATDVEKMQASRAYADDREQSREDRDTLNRDVQAWYQYVYDRKDAPATTGKDPVQDRKTIDAFLDRLRAGEDVIEGGSGKDVLLGGAGADTLDDAEFQTAQASRALQQGLPKGAGGPFSPSDIDADQIGREFQGYADGIVDWAGERATRARVMGNLLSHMLSGKAFSARTETTDPPPALENYPDQTFTDEEIGLPPFAHDGEVVPDVPGYEPAELSTDTPPYPDQSDDDIAGPDWVEMKWLPEPVPALDHRGTRNLVNNLPESMVKDEIKTVLQDLTVSKHAKKEAMSFHPGTAEEGEKLFIRLYKALPPGDWTRDRKFDEKYSVPIDVAIHKHSKLTIRFRPKSSGEFKDGEGLPTVDIDTGGRKLKIRFEGK